jgi:cytochrome c-type biogenesis protein
MMILVPLSYIAGILTLLSPCAFPLVPIFLSSMWQRHRWGPFAFLLGLAFIFTFMGFSLTSSHMIGGFEVKRLRLISALFLLSMSIALCYQPLQAYLLQYAKQIIYKIRQTFYPTYKEQDLLLESLILNSLIGILLGFIWLPFIVPMLSFALTLANRGDYFGQPSILMTLYALGLTTPLIVLSNFARKYLKRNPFKKGHVALKWLGYSLILISFLILTGSDMAMETWVIAHTPQWLLNLTTKY